MQIRPDRDTFEHICEVVCEKGPYCGTNIIRPDQTPRMMRGADQGLLYLSLMNILRLTFLSPHVHFLSKILLQMCENS